VIINVIKTRIFYLPGKYFTGDGALRDEGIRITGRVDDVVIVSGHNLNSPIEDAINEHPAVAESAIVGFRMTLKEMFVWFCNLKETENIEIEKI
jgi:acetyl-CoA synthetase